MGRIHPRPKHSESDFKLKLRIKHGHDPASASEAERVKELVFFGIMEGMYKEEMALTGIWVMKGMNHWREFEEKMPLFSPIARKHRHPLHRRRNRYWWIEKARRANESGYRVSLQARQVA